VWLETKPTADVRVVITAAQVQLVSGDDLLTTQVFTFTPSNWATPQSIQIQAADDYDMERRDYMTDSAEHFTVGSEVLFYEANTPGFDRSHIGVLQHTATSADPFYDSATRSQSCALPASIPVS
jgi:hypothetical protein